MSLINEALRKARLEAARQEAAKRGTPFATVPDHVPRRRRRGAGPLTIVVVALLTAGAVATVFILGVPGRGEAPGEPPAKAAAAPAAAVAQPPDPSAPTVATSREPDVSHEIVEISPPAPVGRAADETAAESRRSRSTAAAAGQQGAEPRAPEPSDTEPRNADPVSVAARRAAAEPGAEPPAAEPTVPVETDTAAGLGAVADSESGVVVLLPENSGPVDNLPPAGPGGAETQSSGLENGATYLRRVALPGGRKIELGGIAWSETGPFALINGRVLGPNEIVEEFRIVRIEPQRVQLQGPDALIFIDLK